jgi:hypothetical protein
MKIQISRRIRSQNQKYFRWLFRSSDGYTCMSFFILNWFGQNNPSELLNNHLKYFRFWLQIRWDIQIFVHSAYYQNTEIFLPRIIRIRKFSNRIFPVYVQFPHVLSANAKFFLKWKIHSVYSQYELNFAPFILTIR